MALLVVLGSCMGDDTEADGDGQGESYYETCQRLNAENPDYYVDPDVCAEDAQQMEDDMTEYLETHRSSSGRPTPRSSGEFLRDALVARD
jgi:hypothetical protein